MPIKFSDNLKQKINSFVIRTDIFVGISAMQERIEIKQIPDKVTLGDFLVKLHIEEDLK